MIAMELDDCMYETFYETNDLSVNWADLRIVLHQWKLRCRGQVLLSWWWSQIQPPAVLRWNVIRWCCFLALRKIPLRYERVRERNALISARYPIWGHDLRLWSQRTVVTFVIWLIFRTEFSSLELVLSGEFVSISWKHQNRVLFTHLKDLYYRLFTNSPDS